MNTFLECKIKNIFHRSVLTFLFGTRKNCLIDLSSGLTIIFLELCLLSI